MSQRYTARLPLGWLLNSYTLLNTNHLKWCPPEAPSKVSPVMTQGPAYGSLGSTVSGCLLSTDPPLISHPVGCPCGTHQSHHLWPRWPRDQSPPCMGTSGNLGSAWKGGADALRLEGTARFQGGAGKRRGLQRWEEESWRPVSAPGLCVMLR